jgi:hypothetical protein
MSRVLLALLGLVPLTGCLLTGALDPDGGGRFTMKIRLVSVANFEPFKKALQSPDVVLKSASMTPDKWATFEFECADVRKISSTVALGNTTVAITDRGDGERTLTATLPNATPDHMSEAYANYLGRDFDLALQLPGPVTHSNAAATAGRMVSWKWPIAELSHHRQLVINASYRPAS